MREFGVHHKVMVRSYRTGLKWVPGTIIEKCGSLHYQVRIEDNHVRYRQVDQLRDGSSQNEAHQTESDYSFQCVPVVAASFKLLHCIAAVATQPLQCVTAAAASLELLQFIPADATQPFQCFSAAAASLQLLQFIAADATQLLQCFHADAASMQVLRLLQSNCCNLFLQLQLHRNCCSA